MEAALIEFELESATQNKRGFYASYASTWHYFTREAVCSALSYADSIWQDRKQDYLPLTFPFNSTPAEPVRVETAEVIYKAGDEGDHGLLRFGKQQLLLPGSRFRCAVWGDLPQLAEGQIFLIGKKRAPARIMQLVHENVEPNYSSEGITLPVQLPPHHVMSYGAFAPLAGTYRYFILKIPLHTNVKRFSIGGFVVPLTEL
jgi:hypothetical protein